MTKTYYKTDQNHPQIKAYKRAVKRGMRSQHVVPRDSSWIVKRAGASRATRVFSNQKQAKEFALNVARNQGTALFVHDEDGRIRDRRYF